MKPGKKSKPAAVVAIMHTFCALFFLMLISGLSGQATQLQVQEISRFAHTSNDMADTRLPVIRYPYVYMPNSFGFQVCEWDSTAGSFTEVANFGVEGAAKEMVAWQNFLFIAVFQKDAHSSTQPEFGMLHKVDISDPCRPVLVGSLTAGANNTSFDKLRIVNDVLISRESIDSLYRSLLLIDPHTLEIMHRYPARYFYEVLPDDHLISRTSNASAFGLFSVDATQGLVPVAELSLPYPSGTFPNFIAIDDSTLATQCGSGVKIWRTSDLSQWELLSTISHQTYGSAVVCNGYLVCGVGEDDGQYFSQVFHVYDISEPNLPTLVCQSPYPLGLDSAPVVRMMRAYNEYLFHPDMTYGCLCLKVTDTGRLEFVAKCYRYNLYTGGGRRYGNYALQPMQYCGITVFDISDPANPCYAFSLFEGSTTQIDLLGGLLYVLIWQDDGDFERIYNISDLHNPVLVYETVFDATMALYFNHEEPGCFYHVDSTGLQIDKYAVIGNDTEHIFRFPISQTFVSKAFANNQFHASVRTAAGAFDLYTFDGFSQNSPQPPTVVSGLLPSPGFIYGVGDYLYLYNISPLPTLSTFYHEQSNFQVDSGHPVFDFLNYVCIGRENGISLYNVNGFPSGYVTAEHFLPQYSRAIHIDWDDDHLYLFSTDNIAIYSYQYTGIDDDLASPVAPVVNCYPNPFGDVLKLDFGLDAPADVLLEVYNIRGQLVKRLTPEANTGGKYHSSWSGKDEAGLSVPSGVYIVKLSVDGRISGSKKVTHIKR